MEVKGVSHPADQMDPFGLTRKEKNKVKMMDTVAGSGWDWGTPHPLPHLGFWWQTVEWTFCTGPGLQLSLGAKWQSHLAQIILFENFCLFILVGGYLHYNTVMVFAIHQYESAIGIQNVDSWSSFQNTKTSFSPDSTELSWCKTGDYFSFQLPLPSYIAY